MKFLVFILYVTAVSHAGPGEIIENYLESVRKAGQECQVETRATDAVITTMLYYQKLSKMNEKGFVACIQEKLNSLGKDGKYNKETRYPVMEQLRTENSEVHVEVVTSADPCDPEAVQELSGICDNPTCVIFVNFHTAVHKIICDRREKKVNQPQNRRSYI